MLKQWADGMGSLITALVKKMPRCLNNCIIVCTICASMYACLHKGTLCTSMYAYFTKAPFVQVCIHTCTKGALAPLVPGPIWAHWFEIGPGAHILTFREGHGLFLQSMYVQILCMFRMLDFQNNTVAAKFNLSRFIRFVLSENRLRM